MRRLANRFWLAIELVMALLLTAMTVLVFANVVLRYGFASGIRQSVELARLWFVWVVMLGSAICLRHGEHLAVAEFSEAWFPRAVPWLRRLCWIVVLLSCWMLLVGSWRQMNANWANISQLTGLPSALFYLAGVVSAVLMGAIGIVRLIDPMGADALRHSEVLTAVNDATRGKDPRE